MCRAVFAPLKTGGSQRVHRPLRTWRIPTFLRRIYLHLLYCFSITLLTCKQVYQQQNSFLSDKGALKCLSIQTADITLSTLYSLPFLNTFACAMYYSVIIYQLIFSTHSTCQAQSAWAVKVMLQWDNWAPSLRCSLQSLSVILQIQLQSWLQQLTCCSRGTKGAVTTEQWLHCYSNADYWLPDQFPPHRILIGVSQDRIITCFK